LLAEQLHDENPSGHNMRRRHVYLETKLVPWS
jgi:hypothetical protein